LSAVGFRGSGCCEGLVVVDPPDQMGGSKGLKCFCLFGPPATSHFFGILQNPLLPTTLSQNPVEILPERNALIL
jgi:hypothetical protein